MKLANIDRRLLYALSIVGFIALYITFTPKPEPEVVNTPATDIAIHTTNGDVSLTSLKGNVVLMDFWATWCGPCRQAMPQVESLYKTYKGEGLRVMGVSTDSDPSMIQQVLKMTGVTYPAGPVVDRHALEPYNVKYIPVLVLVDRKGNIRMRQEGIAPMELNDKIAALLKESR